MRIFSPLQDISLTATEISSSMSGRSELRFSIVHDAEKPVHGLSAFNDPKPQTLIYFSKSKQLSSRDITLIRDSEVHGVILHPAAIEGIEILEELRGVNIFSSQFPYESFLALIPCFFQREISQASAIHPTAFVGENVSIGSSVTIGAYSVIGDNVSIGEGTTIFPHVVIYNDVTIGERCTLHTRVTIREDSIIGNDCYLQNGATIGSDGFGYVPDQKLGIAEVPQLGIVRLGDRVDIGANACVDRATFGETRIATGTKLDNLVQVGHNVTIGSHSMLCAQVGVGGSSTVGNQVVLGGQSGVADHVEISDKVRVGSQSGVTRKLRHAGDYLGFPAEPAGDWRRKRAFVSSLAKHSKNLLQFLRTRKV